MTHDENLKNLEDDIRRELGEEKFARMKELQRQAEQALSRGDFAKAYDIDRQIQALIDPKADLSKPSPAAELTMFVEQLMKGTGATPVQEALKQLKDRLPRLASFLSSIFHGSPDQFERHANDDEFVRKSINLFDDNTISILLSEADSAARSGNPVFAERIYEITQHVLNAKGDTNREIVVGFKAADLCEQLGRFVGAMDWYDIAREASQKSKDRRNYIIASIKYAGAGVKYAPGGMDWQLIPVLEEVLSLPVEREDEIVALNLLIEMYRRKGDTAKVSKLQQRL